MAEPEGGAPEDEAPLHPRRRRALAVGAVLGAGVLAVGGVAVVRPLPVRLAVPTSALVQHDPHAVFDVGAPPSVRAVRHGGTVCFFEAAPGGALLVLPPGYSATPSLQLLDERGEVAAVPGSAVGIAYGAAVVRGPAACGEAAARAVVRIEGLRG